LSAPIGRLRNTFPLEYLTGITHSWPLLSLADNLPK
jgi:hypothetical protein